MSDDHSELVPLLPIPNRTVKRLCADDSVRPYVKVGHRQTPTNNQALLARALLFVAPQHDDLLERSDNKARARSGLRNRCTALTCGMFTLSTTAMRRVAVKANISQRG